MNTEVYTNVNDVNATWEAYSESIVIGGYFTGLNAFSLQKEFYSRLTDEFDYETVDIPLKIYVEITAVADIIDKYIELGFIDDYLDDLEQKDLQHLFRLVKERIELDKE